MEIKFTLDELNKILAHLDELPHRFSRGLIDHIQAIAKPQIEEKMKEVQINGASNPQVQADINQAEANSDSMRNE